MNRNPSARTGVWQFLFQPSLTLRAAEGERAWQHLWLHHEQLRNLSLSPGAAFLKLEPSQSLLQSKIGLDKIQYKTDIKRYQLKFTHSHFPGNSLGAGWGMAVSLAPRFVSKLKCPAIGATNCWAHPNYCNVQQWGKWRYYTEFAASKAQKHICLSFSKARGLLGQGKQTWTWERGRFTLILVQTKSSTQIWWQRWDIALGA